MKRPTEDSWGETFKRLAYSQKDSLVSAAVISAAAQLVGGAAFSSFVLGGVIGWILRGGNDADELL